MDRGLVSTGAAGAFAPAEIFNGCNAPVLRGIVCTKDLKSKETLGNLWLLEDILHPSCRDPNEAPGILFKIVCLSDCQLPSEFSMS